MRTYHLTTFGCQMNEHDSERMKGMLESLGIREVGARDEAVVRRLADRAGVEDDQVGLGALLRLGVADRLEHALHAL